MKIGIVKTIDGSVFKFENPEFFDTQSQHNCLAVITAKKEMIGFPLYNVVLFKTKEVSDETTKKTDVQSKEVNE